MKPTKEYLEALMRAPLRGQSTLRLPGRGQRGPYGYADIPGTGPAGKLCRDCRYDRRFDNHGNRVWHKCLLMKDLWTGSRRTDINARSPACGKFEQRHG